MYNSMKKLILNMHYNTVEDVLNRLNVFYNTKRLTQEQYSELVKLANETYNHLHEI